MSFAGAACSLNIRTQVYKPVETDVRWGNREFATNPANRIELGDVAITGFSADDYTLSGGFLSVAANLGAATVLGLIQGSCISVMSRHRLASALSCFVRLAS